MKSYNLLAVLCVFLISCEAKHSNDSKVSISIPYVDGCEKEVEYAVEDFSRLSEKISGELGIEINLFDDSAYYSYPVIGSVEIYLTNDKDIGPVSAQEYLAIQANSIQLSCAPTQVFVTDIDSAGSVEYWQQKSKVPVSVVYDDSKLYIYYNTGSYDYRDVSRGLN